MAKSVEQVCVKLNRRSAILFKYSSKVLATVEEAKRISQNPQVPGCIDLKALKKALEI